MKISNHTILGLATALLLLGPACTLTEAPEPGFRKADNGDGEAEDGDANQDDGNANQDDGDGADNGDGADDGGSAPLVDVGRPAQFELSFPGELEAGATVTVPVMLDPGDFAVGAYKLELAFDQSLQILEVQSTEDFPEPMAVNHRIDEGLTAVVGLSTTPGGDGPVHVLDLTVMVIEPQAVVGGLSLLSTSQAALYDSYGQSFVSATPTLSVTVDG